MGRTIKIGLKKARENKDISLDELAVMMKVDSSVIEGWEAGASFPTVESLRYLSKMLNVSTEILLFSEQRQQIDISRLSDKQKFWIIDFYRNVIKNK